MNEAGKTINMTAKEKGITKMVSFGMKENIKMEKLMEKESYIMRMAN